MNELIEHLKFTNTLLLIIAVSLFAFYVVFIIRDSK